MMWPLFVAGAYLIGSIPFGVLLARTRGIDIRKHGSGNVGATNVGRVLGRRLGLACFVLDVGKGAIPVLMAGWHFQLLGRDTIATPATDSWWWLGVAFAALAGHMASVFLGFRGGKGVATAFGGLVAMWPTLGLAALAAFAAWIMVVLPTRMVSLASMVAAIVLPAVTVWILLSADVPDSIPPSDVWPRRLPAIIVSSLIGAMILWRHRSNLARIISRTESRIGQ
jgi:glycerol-3-phosphate acyltransferase PlsY